MWTFPVLDPIHMVKAIEEDESERHKYAFPLQLNPLVYSALFRLFAPVPPKSPQAPAAPKSCLHINANVCQSLGVVFNSDFKVHCFESQREMYQPGLEQVAHNITEWNYSTSKDEEEEGEEVEEEGQEVEVVQEVKKVNNFFKVAFASVRDLKNFF